MQNFTKFGALRSQTSYIVRKWTLEVHFFWFHFSFVRRRCSFWLHKTWYCKFFKKVTFEISKPWKFWWPRGGGNFNEIQTFTATPIHNLIVNFHGSVPQIFCVGRGKPSEEATFHRFFKTSLLLTRHIDHTVKKVVNTSTHLEDAHDALGMCFDDKLLLVVKCCWVSFSCLGLQVRAKVENWWRLFTDDIQHLPLRVTFA